VYENTTDCGIIAKQSVYIALHLTVTSKEIE